MKTILLPIDDQDGTEARLQAALDVARAQRAHLVCLQVTPPIAYVAASETGGFYAFPDVLDAVREAEAKLRAATEARLSREDVAWSYEHGEGDRAAMIVARGSLADLIVLTGGFGPHRAVDLLPLVGDVAIHARTPVLAVPAVPVGFDACGRALIAWNGSFEAGNALRAALPLLRQASAVNVLTVTEDDAVMRFPAIDGCEYLSRQGLKAELHQVARNGLSIAAGLLEGVSRLGADYVVMGAYGHSRAREFLLGGVTREMLASCPVPLLLAH